MTGERKTCPACHSVVSPTARECPRCHTRLSYAVLLTGDSSAGTQGRPTCEFHPDRAAANTCGGCHKWLCSSCEICILGQSYCQRCVYIYVDLPKVFDRLARESAERVRLAREQERLAGELRIAHEMQARMLPQAAPHVPGLDVAGFSDPCREVGGDYFDYWALSEGRLAFCVGDVTGKGVPAALLMAMVKSCLFTLATRDPAPTGLIVRSLHSMVRSLADRNQLMTFLYGIIDPRAHTIRFANAGHLYPFLFSPEEGHVRFLEANGLPLGAPVDMEYVETEYQLRRDDRLVLSTDGIVEAHNVGGEMMGFERLQEVIGTTAALDSHGTIHKILTAMRQFTGRAPVEDDTTLVVVRMLEGRDAPL